MPRQCPVSNRGRLASTVCMYDRMSFHSCQCSVACIVALFNSNARCHCQLHWTPELCVTRALQQTFVARIIHSVAKFVSNTVKVNNVVESHFPAKVTLVPQMFLVPSYSQNRAVSSQNAPCRLIGKFCSICQISKVATWKVAVAFMMRRHRPHACAVRHLLQGQWSTLLEPPIRLLA